MDRRDLSYMAELGPERIATSFIVGVNTGPARGVVVKFLFADGHLETVLIPPGLVEPLMGLCRRFLADFRRDSPSNLKPDLTFRREQYAIPEIDYASLGNDDAANGLDGLLAPNALGLEITLRNGERRAVNMAPAVVFHLLDYLIQALPHTRPIPGIDIPNQWQP